jgi:hypothetical protein
MLRHLALFRFVDGVDPAGVEALDQGLRALPEVVPEIREFSCGRDLALREGNADYGVMAAFDDEAGWRAYQENAEHQRVIRELLTPLLSQRTAVQI